MLKLFNLKESYSRFPEIKREQVIQLQQWIKAQPHLPDLPEEEALLFFFACRFNVEYSKVVIDTNLTYRTHIDEFFGNLDVERPEFKRVMNTFAICPIPNTTPEGYRVIIGKLVDTNISNFSYADSIKLYILILELWVREDGIRPGHIIVFDFKGVTLGHVPLIGLIQMKNFLLYLQDAIAIRLVGFHFINTVPFMDKILALMNPFMKQELKDILRLHNSLESFYKYVPKEILPRDYNGPEMDMIYLRQLGSKYKIYVSTVSKIIKNEEKIRGLANSSNLKSKRQRKGDHPNIERALTIWFNDMRSKNAVVTSLMLMNKAKEFAVQLDEEFEPDSSWLFRWRKRSNINFGKIHGESKDNDESSAEDFKTSVLPHLLKEYSADCVFNADESGLYYKALPNTTYFIKGDQPKGYKTQKSRLTLLFIYNSTGSYKRVFCIGKPKKPRCFKNKNIPVEYFSNKNSWMTSLIWNEILSTIDNEMVKENKKIILLIDNASCHKVTTSLSNIEVKFLPPNTTALIQPLDQGIIHAFKYQYRQIIVKKQLCAIEKGKTVPDYLKSVTILDALNFVKRAWWLVKPETIANCFKKAGFHTNTDLNENDEDEDFITEVVSYPSEYLHCDYDLVCFGNLSNEEILQAVYEEDSTQEDDDCKNKDEMFIAEKDPPTTKDILNFANVLRTYCMENELECNFLFDKIEEKALKIQVSFGILRKNRNEIMEYERVHKVNEELRPGEP